MASDEMIQYINDILQEIMDNNDEAITRQILKDFGPNDTREVMYSKMISNAVSISAKLSVQTVFHTLLKMGVINAADLDKNIEKTSLKLVLDSSEHHENDNL